MTLRSLKGFWQRPSSAIPAGAMSCLAIVVGTLVMRNEHQTNAANGSPSVVMLATTVTTAVLLLNGCKRSAPQSTPLPAPAAKTSTAAEETPNQNEEAPRTASELKQPAVAAPLAPVELGKQLFARHCAACHG